MTNQTIPAEKVREVINEINDCLDGTYLNDQARRALEATKVSLGNILPTPPHPANGNSRITRSGSTSPGRRKHESLL